VLQKVYYKNVSVFVFVAMKSPPKYVYARGAEKPAKNAPLRDWLPARRDENPAS